MLLGSHRPEPLDREAKGEGSFHRGTPGRSAKHTVHTLHSAAHHAHPSHGVRHAPHGIHPHHIPAHAAAAAPHIRAASLHAAHVHHAPAVKPKVAAAHGVVEHLVVVPRPAHVAAAGREVVPVEAARLVRVHAAPARTEPAAAAPVVPAEVAALPAVAEAGPARRPVLHVLPRPRRAVLRQRLEGVEARHRVRDHDLLVRRLARLGR